MTHAQTECAVIRISGSEFTRRPPAKGVAVVLICRKEERPPRCEKIERHYTRSCP